MSRRLAPAAALAAALLAGTPGHAATRSWQVTDFSKLRVEGSFDVRVHTGGPATVRATGPQTELDRLAIDQHGDTLVVRTIRSADRTPRFEGPVVVDVSTHALVDTTLTGSGDVAIDRLRGDAVTLTLGGSGNISAGDIDVASALLRTTGSGGLTVKGRARRADALLSGSGDIHGEGFTADAATARLVGSGSLTMAATRTATLDASGSGDLTISGPASCSVHRSGSGEVRCGRGNYGD